MNTASRLFLWFASAALLLGMALGTPAVAQPAEGTAAKPTGKPIVIGVGAPMTGRSAAFGVQVRYGALQAAKEINAAGGLLGRPVEVLIRDDASNANDAVVVAQSFAGNPDVVAVVGHFNSDCSSAAKPIYTEAGMVMLSPASTNVDITKNSDFVFRNIFNDRNQGEALADYIQKVMKMKRVAVLYENDTYGKGLRDYFNARAKELGLEVVRDLAYDTDATDFRPLLTRIRDAKAEVIVTCGLYASGGTIARQGREIGLMTPFIGGDGMFDDALAKIGGKAAEGYLASAPFLMELGGERAAKLAADIKKDHNVEGNAWAALAYDATHILATAIKTAGSTDRKAIREAVAGINSPEKAFPGITGKTYFDAEGDTVKRVVFAVVKNGTFVPAPQQLPE